MFLAEGHQLAPPAQKTQAEESNGNRSEKQDDRLGRVGEQHRTHPAKDRVYASQNHGRERANPEGRKRKVSNCDLQLRQQRIEDDGTGINRHGNLCEDVGNQRDHRENPARGGIETSLQELRHRENF